MKANAIVFAREPIAGRAKTRLIPFLGPRNAAALADAFIRDACRKARRLKPARFVIAADAPCGPAKSRYFCALARQFDAHLTGQGPGDLGARMARVLSAHAGAEGAILFGTDTPSAPLAVLRQSARLLERVPVVLAPALDGGYYLIGVRGGTPAVFRNIRWGSGRVMGQTLKRLRAAGESYALGPWWYDVDRPADLLLLACHLNRRAEAVFAPARPSERVSAVLARAMPLGRALPCPATAALLQQLGRRSHGGCPRGAARRGDRDRRAAR